MQLRICAIVSFINSNRSVTTKKRSDKSLLGSTYRPSNLNIAAGRDWYLNATQYAKIADGSTKSIGRRVFGPTRSIPKVATATMRAVRLPVAIMNQGTNWKYAVAIHDARSLRCIQSKTRGIEITKNIPSETGPGKVDLYLS